MSIMVSVEFSLQEGKQKEFLNILGNVLPDTRAYADVSKWKPMPKIMAPLLF